MKKQVLTAGLMILIFLQATAQIVITRNDMPDPNDILLYRLSTTTGGTDYTATGENYFWDFSGLNSLYIDVDAYYNVSETPVAYQAAFGLPPYNPPATIALDRGGADIIPGISVDDWFDFFKETSSAYTYVGFGVRLNNIPVPIKFDNPETLYTFPLGYGSADSSETERSLPIADFGYYETHRKRVNQVDGWGTITTPFGTFQTIRMVSTLYAHDSIFIDSLGTGYAVNRVEKEYQWLANGYHRPILRIVESNLKPLRIEYYSDETEQLIVDAGPDITISLGDEAMLVATISGGIPPYLITWSNGTIGDTTYVSPQQTWTFSVLVNDAEGNSAQDWVTVTVEDALIPQLIPLHPGWNGISFYIDPPDHNVQQILAPIADNLILVKNQNGMYFPEQGINTLNNWDINSGYCIKLTDTLLFNINGYALQDRTVNLTAGWNILPVLTACPVTTWSIFSQIEDELVIIKPVDGRRVYWPEKSVHLLHNLYPGRAYWIKVNADCSVEFPECGE